MSDFIDIIVKGGSIMVPLLACSIIGLTVVIERWLFWRRIGNRQPAESLLDLVEGGELDKAAASARQNDSPPVRVLVAGLIHRHAMTKALEIAAQREIPLLKQRLTILDTIITLAPLLGLLGTVTGMILRTSVGSRKTRVRWSERQRNVRFEVSHGGHSMLADQLPDRFGFELLRSTFELFDQSVNGTEQRLGFVDLSVLRGNFEMLSPAMSRLARHRREQQRPAGDRFQSGLGISQPH